MRTFLIEDHDEALTIWRKSRVRGLDLVHVDAHIDLAVPPARPLLDAFSSATSIRELKKSLEASLAFSRYEKDFDKQTHIGNYIYPAMAEGLVRDAYWVIPGNAAEFERSRRLIKRILKNSTRATSIQDEAGKVSCRCLGRTITVCTLAGLPHLAKAFLDIDADFLTTKSVRCADNTDEIGRRRPWIEPKKLIERLRHRIRKPVLATVAYSTNGGFTPMRYRHLADELAWRLSPTRFASRHRRAQAAARHFQAGQLSEAVRLNPALRGPDSDYGQLYLGTRKYQAAHREFLKTLRDDPMNPAALLGLGQIHFARKRFKQARQCLADASVGMDEALFRKLKSDLLEIRGRVELELGDFSAAERAFLDILKLDKLRPQAYYHLGLLAQRTRQLQEAQRYFRSARQLGMRGPVKRL